MGAYDIEFRGVIYRSKTKLCEEYGVTVDHYNYYIKLGYTQEQALGLVKVLSKRDIYYKGDYFSINELAEVLDISVYYLTKQIKSGELEENWGKTKTSVEYNGVLYKSESEMCKKLGVDYPTYCGRKKRGLPLEQRLLKEMYNDTSFSYNNKYFNSFREFCSTYKLNYDRALKFRKSGCDLDYIKDKCQLKDNVIFEGIEYKSHRELCKAYEVSYSVFQDRRYKKGFSLRDSLDLDNNHKPILRRPITYDNKYYPRLKLLIEELDISLSLFWKVNKESATVEDSINKIIEQRKANELEFRGKTFDSLIELCDFYKVKYSVFQSRKKRNFTIEQCLGLEASPFQSQKSIEFRGVLYENEDKLAKTYGVRLPTFQYRIKSNWTIEEALGLKERLVVTDKNTIFYKGIQYRDKTDLCEKLGINKNTLWGYICKDLSLEDSIEKALEVKLNKSKKLVVFGKEFDSKSSLADEYKCSVATLNKYLRLSNDNIEDAIELLNNKARINVGYTYEGVVYPSYKSLCSDLKIRVSSLRVLLKDDKLSLEDAITILLTRKSSYRNIEIRGTKYSSITEMCNIFKVSLALFYSRKTRGYALEECLGLEGRGIDHNCRIGEVKVNGFNVKRYVYKGEIDNAYYYECNCTKCGKEDFLTFDEMKEHICEVL